MVTIEYYQQSLSLTNSDIGNICDAVITDKMRVVSSITIIIISTTTPATLSEADAVFSLSACLSVQTETYQK